MKDKYRLKPKNINIEFGGMGMYGTADDEDFARFNMSADYNEAEKLARRKDDDKSSP
ncbi:hypothetical protein [Virgibacillus halodenitrificans]|uniref:hypothetical protein n=1 Tax=Virgibacillus halodenitrificans TaxID=1482 RepID=UPI000AB04D6C|nr:hypothetical protein [Virgibacillus halodenitrificans]MCJ0931838.1 hypothetical protein [Virgibacillus halodenitrificans]WHX25094.1 hypothetical protein QNH47_13045 [Virgibacillus halodenitrificans]